MVDGWLKMEGEIWIERWKERMDGMAGMSSAGNVCLGWKRRKKSLLRDGLTGSHLLGQGFSD